jgi:hypothetical protein
MKISIFSNSQMSSCASCKNITSNERCPNKPLKGIILCGKHARAKNLRLWKDVNKLDSKALIIQKIWRGYLIRSWLTFSGPGVLKREVCHNEDELVTLDEKSKLNPLDYIAFEENSKVFWFDIRSLVEICRRSLRPTNPYTREPLSHDTRQRLRKLCVRRFNRKLSNCHSTRSDVTFEEKLKCQWMYVCQIMEENGFSDMSPMYFTTLSRLQLFIFISFIHKDLLSWACEHESRASRRYEYLHIFKKLIKAYGPNINSQRLSFLTGRAITSILNDCFDNYSICFMIMSSLYRL